MAKKFEFKLEAVLEQRRRAERDRQRVVAGLLGERAIVEARVREIQAGLARGRGDMRQMLAGGVVDVGGVRHAANASLHGLVLLQRAALELAGVMRRLEAARMELTKAMVARKAVENLRAKRYEAWRRAMLKDEERQIDDLVVMRARMAPDEAAGIEPALAQGVGT